MKHFVLTLVLICSIHILFSQKPADGTYTYTVTFAEWGGKSLGATCTVVIKGDSIKVLNNGGEHFSGNKGDILEEGLIMKHTKTGKWIIGRKEEDSEAEEIGGCSDGPTVIDFKDKIYKTC